jgi:hypothetical protein
LLDGAISTGDPDTFDVARFAGLLSALQPELADDVFAKALEVALTERAPRIKFLGELGAFVFSASAANVPTPAVQRPASAQRAAQVAVQQALQSTPERTTVIAGVTIRDITALHPNTDPFNVDAYIGAVLEALKAPDNPYYDAPTAYAIVYQLLATARAMELDTAPSLEQALSKIQVSASVARQVQEFVKGGFAPVPDSTSRKDRLIDQVISAIHLKHFDVARNLLVDLDDRDLRAQLGVLIVFGQAKDALEAKDFEGAFQFANMLRPSVKRVLVYDGFMAGAPPEQALQAVSLAVKDADLLSAAYRAEVLSAAATALMRSDPDRALSVINEVVKSLNNASSRTSNFDPKRFGSTDMAQILVRPTRLDEVVASDRQWHIFALQLPGVSPFTLPAVLRATASTDPARLEAALLEIRDETRLASALNALAELRLNPR